MAQPSVSGVYVQKLRPILQLGAGATLMAAAFWVVSSESGMMLQARFLATYRATDAVTAETYLENDGGTKRAQHLHLGLVANYTVGIDAYRGNYKVKSWDNGYEREAKRFASS